MDYGRRKYGSRPASQQTENSYYPTFHLDMTSIVGLPMRPITLQGGFFDNVIFSLRHWSAPYSSKHAAASLPFDIQHRTFRIATAGSRELWFIVMHPRGGQVSEYAASAAHRTRQKAQSVRTSAIKRHHAELLAEYIKEIFLQGDLIGEGVEPRWTLNRRDSQSISCSKWTIFQELFMADWPNFVDQHSHDEFWAENQPAFHTYDHGANIDIDVGEHIEKIPQETRIENDTDEDEEDEEDEGDEEDEEDEEDEARQGGTTEQSQNADEDADETIEQSQNADEDADETTERDRLEVLRSELEKKYRLANIGHISYALAANLNCLRPGEAVSLLADRTLLADQYQSDKSFSFFPMAFHPRYGNFSSPKPPRFLNNLLAIMRHNMSRRNEGADVLSFGFFQGYSVIKQTMRSRADDLLATKGLATAALTLPPPEARQSAPTNARQNQLLRHIRGELTPDQPGASTPFARERQRVKAAIDAGHVGFRMEQVVTVRVSRLIARRRSSHVVLQPIFQLILFFMKQQASYTAVLRCFRPSVFPHVLCSFATIFEVALAEMDQRFRARGDKGLGIALAEAVAILDRLGSFCFTGDQRVLPRRALRPLLTTEALQKAAWPYISSDVLNLTSGSIAMGSWPQRPDGRPALVHIAALAFHYGPAIATARLSRLCFGQVRNKAIDHLSTAIRFVEDVFRDLWVPEMLAFMTYQLRRRANKGLRSGEDSAERRQQLAVLHALIDEWETSQHPFEERYV
ncbi:hypothetical protein CMUS01_16213 [Colletotrichum musicola]|uniref:Uncharacterized protein n=1 Tax=Colletotrichum musicola TaxID=2175873 RepID=A0A8H6MJ86_9PEZI|nr:hypothetical protein CMUS01_16213 [Colletotrichum musicola]